MANSKFMDHKKGDRFDGHTCSVCDGSRFTVFKVYAEQLQVKCSAYGCGNIDIVERPIALQTVVPVPA